MNDATKAAICSMRPAQRTTVPRDFRALALNNLKDPLFFSFYNSGNRDFVASSSTGSLLLIGGSVWKSDYCSPKEAIGGVFAFRDGNAAV